MYEQQNGSIFNEIRERRKHTVEIILIVFVAGVGVNLFSTVVFDWIEDYRYSSIITTCLFPSLVSITLLFFLREKISQSTEFRIFIPLNIGTGSNYSEKIKGYAPTMYLEKFFSTTFKHNAEKEARFKTGLSEWLNANKEDNLYFTDVILEIVSALALGVIREYGEHTLSTAVLYHEKYRNLAWHYKSYIIERDSLPAALKDAGAIIGKIRMPEGISLNFKKDATMQYGKIVLESSVATLEIEFLSYWSVITMKSSKKTVNIAIRNIDNKDQVVLMSVPVKCSLIVKQHKVFARQTELFYEWMYGLLGDLNQWLSWDEYAKGDRERILVEVYKKVERL